MRLLVAGVGNIFFGDDGFGPEVARALAGESTVDVKIEDFGIRGIHLAYELVAGYDRAIVIDAVPRGGTPGSLYVIEPDILRTAAVPDPHRMDLEGVFAMFKLIGGEPAPITIVGCEPSAPEEVIGLSEPVRKAVEPAIELVRRLIAETLSFGARRAEKRSKQWTEA